MSQELLEEREKKMKILEELNQNPYTFEYIVKNNMGGCRQWISPFDKKWFGKFI